MKDCNIILVLMDTMIVFILAFIAAIDIRHMKIDQKLLYMLLLVCIAAAYTNQGMNVSQLIAAPMFVALFLIIIHYLSRKGLGWGDVKLCSCIALRLGIEKTFTMLFISLFLCSIAALILMALNKLKDKKEMPFAPFAAIGTLVVLMM